MRRFAAVVAIAFAVCLLLLFAYRELSVREPRLPTPSEPASLHGMSCESGLAHARQAQTANPEAAMNEYLWLASGCSDQDVQPDALLDLGALLTYQLNRPRMALVVYQTYLQRFPNHVFADLALRNMAQIEIDNGDYSNAVSHLKELATRFPDSRHKESALFLIERAADALARQQRRGLLDYIKYVVPDNPTTAIAVLALLLPLVIRTFMTWHKEPTTLNSVLFALVIVCVVITAIINYADQSKQESQLSRDIATLTRW